MSKNFKALGITSQGVKSCNDETQLLDWKLSVDAEITETANKINTAKAKAASTGEFSSPDWFAKIHGYKKILGCLSQLIQFRLRQLRFEKAENSSKSKKEYPSYFMSAAKEYLPEGMFDLIKELATSKMNQNVESN